MHDNKLLAGYWDYCLYKDSAKPDWVSLSWNVKHDLTWAEIKADPTFGGYHPPELFTQSVVTTFENEWDVLPAGRVKVNTAISFAHFVWVKIFFAHLPINHQLKALIQTLLF